MIFWCYYITQNMVHAGPGQMLQTGFFIAFFFSFVVFVLLMFWKHPSCTVQGIFLTPYSRIITDGAWDHMGCQRLHLGQLKHLTCSIISWPTLAISEQDLAIVNNLHQKTSVSSLFILCYFIECCSLQTLKKQ